jgi:hypothetical protein
MLIKAERLYAASYKEQNFKPEDTRYKALRLYSL